jgi:hypothetical protein
MASTRSELRTYCAELLGHTNGTKLFNRLD